MLESTFPVKIDKRDTIKSGDDFDFDSETASETKLVLDKINARRVVHSEFAINNLESEPLDGLWVRLEKGRLGLMKSI